MSTHAPSGPVTEIVSLPIKPLFKEDPSIFQKVMDGVEGVEAQHWGEMVEDANMVYWFLHWPSYEAQQKWRSSSNWDPILSLAKSIAGIPEINIVSFDPPFPSPVLEAALKGPIVEVAVTKLKPETTIDAFKPVAMKMGEFLEKNEECLGTAVGRVRGDERVIVSLLSWTSVEAHTEGLYKMPGFMDLMPEFGSHIAQNKTVHLKINKK